MNDPSRVRFYTAETEGELVGWLRATAANEGSPLAPWVTELMDPTEAREKARQFADLAEAGSEGWFHRTQVVVEPPGVVDPLDVAWCVDKVEKAESTLRCEWVSAGPQCFVFSVRVDGDMCNLAVVDRIAPVPLLRMYGYRYEYLPANAAIGCGSREMSSSWRHEVRSRASEVPSRRRLLALGRGPTSCW